MLCTLIVALLASAGGCAAPSINPQQPASESDVLRDVTQLTRGFTRAGDAIFSPDMRWIAFHAAVPGERADQLFVAPLQRDGQAITGLGRPIRISPKGSANAGVAMSPDGNSVVFASTGTPEPSATTTTGPTATSAPTRLFRADNWQPAVASAEPGSIVDFARYPFPGPATFDAQPAWSPDGKWIAFANQDGDNVDVHVARPNGTDRVRITHSPGFDGYPAFSPDGKRLLYSAARADDRTLDVYVIQLTVDEKGNITGGRGERALTKNVGIARKATWHPDGKHVLYASKLRDQEGYRLRVIRADGSMRTDVTLAGPSDTAPVVSPDGRYLLWTARKSPDGSPQVFIARLTLPKGV
jgi:Tol biopolymer transport system component